MSNVRPSIVARTADARAAGNKTIIPLAIPYAIPARIPMGNMGNKRRPAVKYSAPNRTRPVLPMGSTGLVLFGALYFTAGLLLLPMFPIGILAGMAYGMAKGMMVLLPAALASAVLATILGRTLLKAPVLGQVP